MPRMKTTASILGMVALLSTPVLAQDDTNQSPRQLMDSNILEGQEAHGGVLADASPQVSLPATGAIMDFDALPDEGSVMVSGDIQSVSPSGKTFTLVDPDGNTLLVENADITIPDEGTSISVRGEMASRFLGMGQKLVATRITPDSMDSVVPQLSLQDE